MKHTFTEDDIIKFLYNEMSIRESEAFLDALYTDDQLWETFESYQHVVDKMIRVEVDPSEESYNNILKFVAETQPNTTSSKSNSGVSSNQLRVMMMGVLILVTSLAITGSIYLFQTARQNQQQASIPETPETMLSSPLEWEDTNTEKTIRNIWEKLDDIRETSQDIDPDDNF